MVCYRPLFSVCRFLMIELWATISQTQYNFSKDLVASFSVSFHLHMMNNPCTSHISVVVKWLPEVFECFYNVFFPKSKGLFSVGSSFHSARSTCELNQWWRNMSENMTWWNQLPVDGAASHTTITSRALRPRVTRWRRSFSSYHNE